jgi:hypothetical protein
VAPAPAVAVDQELAHEHGRQLGARHQREVDVLSRWQGIIFLKNVANIFHKGSIFKNCGVQGDQIGRIFVQCKIVKFGQFLWKIHTHM